MKILAKDDRIIFVLTNNDKTIKQIYINNELYFCAYIDIHEENTGWYVIYKNDDIKIDEKPNSKDAFRYTEFKLSVLNIYKIRRELLDNDIHFNSLDELVYEQGEIFLENGKLVYPSSFPKNYNEGLILHQNDDWMLTKTSQKHGGNYVLMIDVHSLNNNQYIKYSIEPKYLYLLTKSNIEREVNKLKNTRIYIYFREGSKTLKTGDSTINYLEGLFPTSFGHIPCQIEFDTTQVKKVVYCPISEDKLRKLEPTVADDLLELDPHYYISRTAKYKNRNSSIRLKKYYNEYNEDFETYRTITRTYWFENNTKGKFIAKKIASNSERYVDIKLTPSTIVNDQPYGFITYYNVAFSANGLTTIGNIKIHKRYIRSISKN